MNILSDIAITLVPIWIIAPLQMSWKKRTFMVLLLSTRILYVVANILFSF